MTKTIQMECGQEVTCKGKNILLDANKGVTTERRHLAAKDDPVMGIDVHDMVVPSGSGTTIVPIPHQFIGKMASNLSPDVKVRGDAAATMDSIARHDCGIHMQVPGTISFVTGPRKEGDVTGATGRTVFVNGKQVAVLGSTLTTCNDVGARENTTIIAAS